MQSSSIVVIDASTAVSLALGQPLSKKVDALWKTRVLEGRKICVPCLWLNDVTSALHRIMANRLISETRASDALVAIILLGVEIHEQDASLCRAAFDWATQQGQSKTYNSFYLALAEKLDAQLWTANGRLARRAEQLRLSWVRYVETAGI